MEFGSSRHGNGSRQLLTVYTEGGVMSIAPESDAKKKWMREHTTLVVIKLNHNTDADILQKLNAISNRQGYIKTVIRKDIADNREE